MPDLTITEVGERWPMAAVLWDRDVISVSAWDPVFRVREDSVIALHVACASDVKHRPGCPCRIWDIDRERWLNLGRVERLNADLLAGRLVVPRFSEWLRMLDDLE